jgi:hypothetical protein
MNESKYHIKTIQLISMICLITCGTAPSFAISPIIRTHQSVRTTGMGNVRYTTGIYEENFYANPARITENSKKLLQIPKFTFEAGSGTLASFKDLLGSSRGLSAFSDSVGKPISARFQLVIPALHQHSFITTDWSMSAGLLMNAQMVGQVSQSGEVSPTTIIGGGPAFTIARRLLPEDRLSIGLTTHLEFRATSGNAFSILDFLRGQVANSLRGGSGMGIDFDLGTSFRPHWGLGGFSYELGLAVNNILGGSYHNLGGKISGWSGTPTSTPTSLNLGLAAKKEDLWKFKSFVMALEFTDIGNNVNGSFYRLIHFGAEALWKKLAIRTGFNQGYICGGLGFDANSFQINASTYGEELGLNAGSLQDRRYALDLGFQI